MTADDLRDRVVSDIDRLLNAPRIVQRQIGEESLRIIRASRQYWQTVNRGAVEQLLSILNLTETSDEE